MVAIAGYILIIVVLTTGISLGLNAERNMKLKDRIESCWGKDADERLSSDDLKTIAEYFNNRKQDEKGAFFIDEITWNDLSMDSIFEKINTTESSPGEQYLYNILREPLYDEEKLKYRDKLIKFFQTHEKERKKIQYILAKLGKKRNCFISDYFYNSKGEKRKSNLNFYRALAILPIAGICITFLNPYIGLVIVSIACVTNVLVYYIDQNNIKYKIESFKYIVQIVKVADLILKENLEELEIYNKKLKKAITLIKSIKNASFTLGNNGTDVGVMNEYISIIFLLDLINYEKISNTLIEKSEEFKIIFEVVGIIDSSISIASYRERLKGYVTPELVKCLGKQDATIIFKDINHPLMKEQVSNSMKVSDSILITGSNASGKSTFLKTVAINIILAQTIYTCLAKEFKCCYFKIYTSMALKDDIFNNESYYIAETKSLKRIIDALNCDIPTICFIDEILRGTNTVERISASSQVLKYLTSNNCICVAATHDVELTYILERYFSNYHFEEKIIDNQITFDYLVHQGRSNTQNAIRLLGILGYSDVIVKKAEEKAYKFLKDGVWEAE
ncbi:MutS-related protein [Clostridium scatologenes]|uniref:DNA mismatch repair protein MutS domain protein n=1 Tax=Clostridium scatologenes TaxID=1548 RepID=A0A0E3K1X4_CLOSL|nr:DNA mismatch repair protein MutS [Clostridium scatologenes]AKA70345.1 DNA mismatch repair protein MutS domain protein [Clostridium scatologenes]